MDEELQKQSSESLTWQQQPEQFLETLGDYLASLQLIYRTQLPPAELVVWRETLKDYSLAELQRAMGHLVRNPPKYDPGDGSIQLWRGMPKLPDVVQVMVDFRERRAAVRRREKEAEEVEEMRELQRRKDAGEKFYGLADVLKAVPSAALKPMPTVRTQFPDIDPGRNRAELERQREQLLKGK